MRAKRVLTRPRGWALLAAVVVAAAVPLVGATLGGASIAPSLTIKKVVTGPVPPGTTFTVTVDCLVSASAGGASGSSSSTSSTEAPVHAAAPVLHQVITFDAQGHPTSANSTFPVGFLFTCTATETVTGGAQSVSYSCAVVGTPGSTPADTTCSTNQQTVNFGPLASGVVDATITVTNKFPDPTPPPVVVSPRFTG
jgi:hypothetical protein